MPRIRRLAVAAVLVVVAGAVVVAMMSRPQLDRDRRAVDRRWAALITPLNTRYARLGALTVTLGDAGAAQRDGVRALATQIPRWTRLIGGHDHAAQASAADTLEGLAARARAVLAGSARLQANADVQAALKAFDATTPASTVVGTYNDAVRSYQRCRQSTLRRLVATPLGFDPRPTLQIPGV